MINVFLKIIPSGCGTTRVVLLISTNNGLFTVYFVSYTYKWPLDNLANRLYFGVYCILFFCLFFPITRWWIKLLILSKFIVLLLHRRRTDRSIVFVRWRQRALHLIDGYFNSAYTSPPLSGISISPAVLQGLPSWPTDNIQTTQHRLYAAIWANKSMRTKAAVS